MDFAPYSGTYVLKRASAMRLESRSEHLEHKGSFMVFGACPECDADVLFDGPPKEGDRVTCPVCATSLLVIGETPIELDWDPAALDRELFGMSDEDFDLDEG
jgi:hypothetical protein